MSNACGRTWPPYRVDRQISIKLPPSDYLRKLCFDTVFLDQERVIPLDRPNCEIGNNPYYNAISIT